MGTGLGWPSRSTAWSSVAIVVQSLFGNGHASNVLLTRLYRRNWSLRYSTKTSPILAFEKLCCRLSVMNCRRIRWSWGSVIGFAGSSIDLVTPGTDTSPPPSPGWSFWYVMIWERMSEVVLSSS